MQSTLVLSLILSSLTIGCANSNDGIQQNDLNGFLDRSMPNGWLLNETRQSDPVVREQAVHELLVRWKRDRSSREEIGKLAARFLDGEQSWFDTGQVIVAARADGNINDERWESYLREMLEIDLKFRSKVHRGDPIPMQSRGGQFSWRSRPTGKYDLELRSLQINGADFSPLPELGEAGHTVSLKIPPEQISRLHDGPQTVTAVVEAHGIYGDLPFRFSVNIKSHFDFVPANEPTLKLVTSDADRQAVVASLSMGPLERIRRDKSSGSVRGVFACNCNSPPVAICMNLFFRSNGREWKFGSVMGFKGQNTGSSGFFDVNGFGDGVGEWIFRPDPGRAAKFVGITEIWGEEVVLKNVAMKITEGLK